MVDIGIIDCKDSFSISQKIDKAHDMLPGTLATQYLSLIGTGHLSVEAALDLLRQHVSRIIDMNYEGASLDVDRLTALCDEFEEDGNV
jgi:hypothetical protein